MDTIKSENGRISLSTGQAALIAGIVLLVIVITAITAEFYISPQFIVPGNAEETSLNIQYNKPLVIAGIFCYLIAFIGDVVVGWALYVFLKPVNNAISLLTGWFRLVYATLAVIATLNLLKVLSLLRGSEYLAVFDQEELHAEVFLSIVAFGDVWWTFSK